MFPAPLGPSENDVSHRTPYPFLPEFEPVQRRLGKDFVEGARLGACLKLVELRRADDNDGVSATHGDTLRPSRCRQAHDFAELRLGLGKFPSQPRRRLGI